MKKMQYKKLSFSLLIVLLAVIPLASAFGVTTHYWDDKPLIMYPGQTKDVDVVLQNMVDEDLRVKAEITEGSEIAALIDPDIEYIVPLGRKDIKVNIRVTIPENASLEDRYNIKVSFKQAAGEGGGMVQMTSSVGATIPVVIKSTEEVPVKQEETPKTEEKLYPTAIAILFLVILIIIIGYIIFKRRNKQ